MRIPADISAGTYTLKIFNEQISDSYKSNFSSAFCDIALTVKPAYSLNLSASALTGGQTSNVYYGQYYDEYIYDGQMTDPSSYSMGPIKWRVLDSELEHNSDGVFMISDTALDIHQYNSTLNGTTWESSSIRSWLNNDFLNTAFQDAEQNMLSQTDVINATSDGTAGTNPNPEYSTAGGNNTKDKVFLLSVAEAENRRYFPNDGSRTAKNTVFTTNSASHSGNDDETLEPDKYADNSFWWLRSPGQDSNYAAIVNPAGDVKYDGASVDFMFYTARPAIRINQSAVLFTSAAKNGKSSSNVTDRGELAKNPELNITGNDGYKLTMLDSARTFTATAAETNNKTVTYGAADATFNLDFTYNNASFGDNEYISAMIVNEAGDVLYYSQLKKSNSPDGTVSFKIPYDIDAGEYTIKLFNELLNSDCCTDYASAFVDFDLTVTKSSQLTAGDFTLTPPADLLYDENPKTAAVAANRIGVGDITVKYYDEDDNQVQSPTETGSYTVKIDVAAGSNYDSASDIEIGSFTIAESPLFPKTEAKLRSAVEAGTTPIKLTGDITLTDDIDFSGKSIMLNLNGHVISAGGDFGIVLNAQSGTNLTLTDSDPSAVHDNQNLPLGGVIDCRITGKRIDEAVSYFYTNGGSVTGSFYSSTGYLRVHCTSTTATAFYGTSGGDMHVYAGIYYGDMNANAVKGKKVTFMNGENVYAYEIVEAGKMATAPNTPERAGYQTFDGWYITVTEDSESEEPSESEELSEAAVTEEKYSFSSAVNDDIILNAKFIDPINYTITYTLDDGTVASANPETYTVEDTITLNNPVKTGYTFTGWSGTGLDGENNITAVIPAGSSGNREYTAHFSEKGGYSVSFDTDGGTSIDDLTDVKWTDFVFEGLQTPVKEGYTFRGWFYGDTYFNSFSKYSDLAAGDDTVLSVDVTAHWREKYDISFNEQPQTYKYDNTPKSFEICGTSTTYGFTVSYEKDGIITADPPTDAGIYNVTVTRPEDWIYKKTERTITGGLTIEPESLEDSEILLAETILTYNGSEQVPEISVTVGEWNLTQNIDYRIDGSYKTSVGSDYQLVIEGIGNFTGKAAAKTTFSIVKIDSETRLVSNSAVYGECLTLSASVSRKQDNGISLFALADDTVKFYTVNGLTKKPLLTVPVLYDNENKDSGTASIDIETTLGLFDIGETKITAEYGGSVNLNGSGGDTITVTINPKEVELSWSGNETRIYDGTASNVTAEISGIETGSDVRAAVTGGDKTDNGKHTAEAKLIGADAKYYTLPENASTDYVIERKDITVGAEIGEFSKITYNGEPQTPYAPVTVDGMEVTGYWSDVIKSGDKTTFTATGNFCGEIAGIVPSPAIEAIVVNNGENSYTVEPTLHNIDFGCTIIVSGYNHGKLMIFDSKTYSKEISNSFTIIGNIDEIRIMAWHNTADLTPLCEAVKIPQKEWITK